MVISLFSKFRSLAVAPALMMVLTLGMIGCGNQKSTEDGSQSVRSSVENGPVRLTVAVHPKSASLADELTLTVTLDAKEGVEVEKPLFGEDIGEFVIRDFYEALPKTENGREITAQEFKLEPMTTGALRIDPITASFKNESNKHETIQSETLTVQIDSVLGEKVVDLADLKPAAAPVHVPGSVRWLVALALAGGGVLLAGAILLWRRYRRLRGQAKLPSLSPKELAALELQKLMKSGLSETDLKLFYVELTAIVRRYIERTAGVHAPEQTTEEFLREISHHPAFTATQRDRLANFLESADLVKFAGYQPMATAVDESVRRARVFVDLEEEVTLPHEPVRNGWHARESSLLTVTEKDNDR